MTSGLFITFEGVDGCGKSTQLAHCDAWLRAEGHDVLLTRNPGGTALGTEIRRILLHHPGYVSPTAELLLYIADRAQHMDECVAPALQAGRIILCDRYHDSTLAYQGFGRGLDISEITQLNALATHGRAPDLTFLFDGPPEALRQRVANRGAADRLESEQLAFYERVAQGFRTLAAQEPQRFVTLDARESIETLQAAVAEAVRRRLPIQATRAKVSDESPA
ncbi:MAG: dTMP kinase [Vampirovibrionales bacterium]|nr:dTMP kinase [Vampirovibrionales bacterium]